MKLRYTLLPIILFTLFIVKVSGQTTKPCYDFDCAYKKAESLLNASKYQSALDNLDSAEGYLTNIQDPKSRPAHWAGTDADRRQAIESAFAR